MSKNNIPRAIKTNGIGRKSDYHINRTQSMSEFMPKSPYKNRIPAPKSKGIPYAGKR